MWVCSWYLGLTTRLMSDDQAVQHQGFTTEAAADVFCAGLEGKQKVVWFLDDVAPVWVQKETAA